MNKEKFIEELGKRINYDIGKCTIINDVLENNFIIGKKNKEKIVSQIMEKLSIDYNESNYIYEVCMDILNGELKYKLKHPFKDLDK